MGSGPRWNNRESRIGFDRGDTLHDRGCRVVDPPRFIGNHPQFSFDGLQQFSVAEQKIRITRTAKVLVSDRECLVDQYAIGGQAIDQDREKRPVQVVRHHDAIEHAPGQRPGTAVLKVRFDNFDTRAGCQPGRIPVDGRHIVTCGGEHVRMAAAATGDIKHRSAGRNQRCTALNPGGRARRRGCDGHIFITLCNIY